MAAYHRSLSDRCERNPDRWIGEYRPLVADSRGMIAQLIGARTEDGQLHVTSNCDAGHFPSAFASFDRQKPRPSTEFERVILKTRLRLLAVVMVENASTVSISIAFLWINVEFTPFYPAIFI